MGRRDAGDVYLYGVMAKIRKVESAERAQKTEAVRVLLSPSLLLRREVGEAY